jgi:uncharacterized integral membrane protein (TIGR00698 family)
MERKSIWPGVALALGLAVVAQLAVLAIDAASGARVPVSAVLIAILLGFAARNLAGKSQLLEPGLDWVGKTLLRVGIALVGLRLTLSGFSSVVLMAAPIVAACIATAIVTSVALGRLFRLRVGYALLIALGTAVCGCTAIIAASPVLRARAVDTTVAVTCVVLLGCTGMLLYPWIAHAFFADAPHLAGVFLATSIHDTSQVIGAALLYAQQFGEPEVAGVAALTKMLRNLSMLVLIPVFGRLAMRDLQYVQVERESPSALKRSQFLPTFLLWFVALAAIRLAGDAVLSGEIAQQQWLWLVGVATTASEWLLACGMVTVGYAASLPELRAAGSKPIACAFGVAAAVFVVSLTLTMLYAAP